jgi:hypothetical protein
MSEFIWQSNWLRKERRHGNEASRSRHTVLCGSECASQCLPKHGHYSDRGA